jgi:endonuclease YncB( thermonuclease family)
MISKSRTKILISFFVFILLFFAHTSLSAQFLVTSVYDGDTLTVESEGYKFKVLLIGIDAPETYRKKNEPGQPFSNRAKIHLQKLVLNKTVELEGYGLDQYSRVLGVVYFEGINVNLEMVKEGLAEIYKGKPEPGFDNRPYWDAEQEARKNRRGMWSLGDEYISPKEWRKGKRND